MGRIVAHTAAITTAADGSATVYCGKQTQKPDGSAGIALTNGRIVGIKFTSTDMTDDFDVTITGETTGWPILIDETIDTATDTWSFPKQLAHNGATGDAATDAFTDAYLVNERAKIVVANGGATTTGTVTIYVEE